MMNLKLDHISYKSAIHMCEISAPLFEFLGLNYFAYRRIFDDGRHITLGTSPEWIEQYYKNGYYKKKETQKRPVSKKYIPVVWEKLENKDTFSSNAIKHSKERYGFANSLTLIKSQEEYTDLYSFSAPSSNQDVNDKYLSYLEYIEKFIFYFHQKAAPLIEKAKNSVIIIPDAPKILDFPEAKKRKIEKFEQNIRISRLVIPNGEKLYKLTERETDCLIQIAQGMATKEIARNLKISVRTVEAYRNSLKIKLNCSLRSQLFEYCIDYMKAFL